jgi:AcrR family transcriptional regulator
MPSKPPRPRNRAELPGHISHVAHVLFESEGYARVTMEQIARRAAVSKRTLYKYFPVKEALLERLLEATLAEDLAGRDFGVSTQIGFRAQVMTLLHESAGWCEQHTDYLLPYIRYKFASFDPSTVSAEDRGLLPVWTQLIGAAQQRGELASGRPPEQLGIYFHYLYLGALMRWLTAPQLDLRKEFATVIALFLEGTARVAEAMSKSTCT